MGRSPKWLTVQSPKEKSLEDNNDMKEEGLSSSEGKRREPDTKSERPASLGNYIRVLSYTNSTDRVILMIAMLSAIGSGVALPLMNIVFGSIVGKFNEYFSAGTTVTVTQFKSSVSRLSLYIVYLFIGKFIMTYFAMASLSYCFRIIGLRVSATLRQDYMRTLFAQPVSKLDQVPVGAVTNTITTHSNSIQQSISDKLAILFQSVALLVTAYIVAFKYSWALTLVTSSALLFIFVVASVTLPRITRAQRSVDKANESQSSIAAAIFGSIRTVVSLGAEGNLAAKYTLWIEEARQRGRTMSLFLGAQLGLMFFAMYSSYSLAFWFGLQLYRGGHLASIDTVITVFFSVMMAITVIGRIASPLVIMSKAASAAETFFQMLDSEKVDLSGLGLRGPSASAQADIVFENVHFAYPSRPDIKALNGLNARFERGKTTALVGPSGSGKSTIVALLERWYQLSRSSDNRNSGTIYIGEHSINNLDLTWWRSQVGLVQQEPVLFNDTIYNNIALGLVGTKWEHETDEIKKSLIENACCEAYAHEFIQHLPEGYETLVGENGIKLSGGQRQRLAIARSIVRQPAILILDEATSAIDVRGEKIVQAALNRLSQNRTTIVIAHRLSTIRQADRIIVVKGGVDIEQGTHEELLEIEDGVYSSLVNAQRVNLLQDDETDISDMAEESKEDLEAIGDLISESINDDGLQLTKKSRGFFRSIGLFLYEQRAQWQLYLPVLISAAGAGAAYPLQSWLFAKLIAVFQYSDQRLAHAANFWALMFFILALGTAACYGTMGYSASRFSAEVSSVYRTEYFHNILNKPIPFHDLKENSSGSLVSRLTTDSKQVQDIVGINGAFPLVSIFSILGCIIIAFSFGWKLSLVAVFAALPCTFLAAFMRIRYEIQFEAMNAKVYSGSSQFAAEAIDAFRTVSALTMEHVILERYSNLLQQQQTKAFRKAWYATLVFAFSDSVELCAMALTFWYGGQLLASRQYQPTDFFVIYSAIIQGGQSAGQFFSSGSDIAQAIASANRMLDLRPNRNEPTNATIQPESLRTRHGATIEFKKVTFRYPSRATPLFMSLNVRVETGQFVAFVGPSGCGKTTVISLLEKFYNPFQGTILINDQNIHSIEPSYYRRSISLVAQEPRLFEGTIRENLALGLDQSDFTETDLIQACKDAEIHDFIASLPEGYSTNLGIKAQTSLSGGQRQRLCIARALLRRPSLLLLDEATSSLDSQSEKVVQAALERLAAKRCMTIVVVAHRLATIQKADKIFVFGESRRGSGSRIVEQGTHQELLRNKGTYWQMCQQDALDR
ncbi:hypothetical protein ASPFODRAFT_148809 [Aspergillus luchuensis CBS 106.47]|uniref:ABC multidrug transporter MDR2 n=1 Tax=Aspergillus luchuensis (strain CBS 106.47) TaxID=1137211 RepID=A0A1M3SYS5_ASPLC|nr:hypothetical protein ASPFODRAFT_148809 [Aspergillus luchuensis CBS 106.47]